LLGEPLPGHEVTVVLQNRQEDFVAAAQQCPEAMSEQAD
jgi:hypothetical protein